MSTLIELAAMGTLCCWTVSVLIGLGFCAPDRAMAMGLPGTILGNTWFQVMGWSAGPVVLGYTILPGLIGTTLMLILGAFARQLYDDLTAEKQAPLPPSERRWGVTDRKAHPPS